MRVLTQGGIQIKVVIKLVHEAAIVPKYQTKGATGFDFHAVEARRIPPGSFSIVPTGVAMEIPEGYELQVRGRSGLAFKQSVLAFLGTIDSDYRGEIKVLLFNLGSDYLNIWPGDRIAQGVLAPFIQAEFIISNNLSETERNTGGFGSTGKEVVS